MPLAGPIKCDVVFSFPLTTEKLENIYIDARLYEYDPFLADASATLLDHVELEGINFSATSDSLVNINFSATRKTRMKYYVTARTYSTKGGTLYFYINGFQKIFELVDTENINIAMTSKLTTKKPDGDPINVNLIEKMARFSISTARLRLYGRDLKALISCYRNLLILIIGKQFMLSVVMAI